MKSRVTKTVPVADQLGGCVMRKCLGYLFAVCTVSLVTIAGLSSFDIAYAQGGYTPPAPKPLNAMSQCLRSGGRWGRFAVYDPLTKKRLANRFECIYSDRCRRSEFPC